MRLWKAAIRLAELNLPENIGCGRRTKIERTACKQLLCCSYLSSIRVVPRLARRMCMGRISSTAFSTGLLLRCEKKFPPDPVRKTRRKGIHSFALHSKPNGES